ncbi:Spy/CpxP family protein refolding chaperone [Zavarzinia compransoris]|uniref:Spy/CpxP family protein refolding chaperone n=1 Tax=Zavarzinia marina TaxID=2911065 RepID=UPI001F45F740|nr:Spy/CpxP family protein refolding chaperone [Zavarzinia marina]MCF4165218.1 Spy/CpxP family protein refolding chaperone [Zavarzinia marina]
MNKRLMAGLGLAALIGTAAIGAGSAFARAEGPSPNGPRAEAGRMMDPARMADRCTDRFARESARLTYMETKLDLTDAQQPLWQAYADAVTKGNAADRDTCLEKVKTMPPAEAGEPRQRPTAVEREAMRIERLEAELSQAKATEPALTKLYGALDEDQQKILDKPARHHGQRPGMTRARFDRGGDCRPDFQRHGFGHPGTGPGPSQDPRGDQPPPPRG